MLVEYSSSDFRIVRDGSFKIIAVCFAIMRSLLRWWRRGGGIFSSFEASDVSNLAQFSREFIQLYNSGSETEFNR